MPSLFLLEAALLIGLPFALWRWAGLHALAPLAVLQIMVGLALGPSILGELAPDLHASLFPPPVVAKIGSVASIAVVLYACVTGMHLDVGALRRMRGLHWQAAGSFLVPLALGSLLGLALLELDPAALGPAAAPWQFALAIGTLTAVTALPVLAALLKEIGLLHTSLGQQAVGLAALNDAALWILLSVLLLLSGTGSEDAHPLYLPLFLLGMLGLRALLAWASARRPLCAASEEGLLVLICALAFAAAFLADRVGLGYVFGGFLAGLIVPARLRPPLLARLEWPTTFLLMPFFFMATGLRTEADLLAPSLLWLMAAATAVAIFSKLLGAAVPALLAGQPWRHALALGILLQTKGLMEVLVLTILLDAGIITDVVFSALVMMAIICTATATPLVRLLQPPVAAPQAALPPVAAAAELPAAERAHAG